MTLRQPERQAISHERRLRPVFQDYPRDRTARGVLSELLPGLRSKPEIPPAQVNEAWIEDLAAGVDAEDEHGFVA